MSDALYARRRFRTFNVLDEGIREALTIVIDTSIASGRVIRELDKLVEVRGRGQALAQRRLLLKHPLDVGVTRRLLKLLTVHSVAERVHHTDLGGDTTRAKG